MWKWQTEDVDKGSQRQTEYRTYADVINKNYFPQIITQFFIFQTETQFQSSAI